jgi:prolyl-tRNA synthetase
LTTKLSSSVSPLALNKATFPKVVTVLDASIASSSSTFGLHANSSSSTLFLEGSAIQTYLRSLETEEHKIQELDFSALKTDTPGSAAKPAIKGAAKEKEDAKIEGAVQLAIGVKKEGDFASWYTNVNIPF